jgi:hypothetical protein
MKQKIEKEHRKVNETKNWLFEQVNIDKYLARLTNKKE